MLKDITNCPHCGIHLPDYGVIELRGFCVAVDSSGAVSWEAKRSELDEIEGYICSSCNNWLAYRCDVKNECDQLMG